MRRAIVAAAALGIGALLASPALADPELGADAKADAEAPAKADKAPLVRLEITTDDRQGTVVLDGKEVGEGAFSGEVAAGKHELRVTRDGYEPHEQTLDLQNTTALTVSLKEKAPTAPDAPSVAEATSEAESPLAGFYGGVGLLPAFGVGGIGHETELRCNELGADSCTSPSTFGGGLLGYFGYTGNPVGIELFTGLLFDQSSAEATFTGRGAGASANPLAVGAPRTEDFTVWRVGGLAAVRARLTLQNRLVRGTFAAGAGFSYKNVWMRRSAETTDGRGLADEFIPESQGYLSPALTFDAAAGLRLSPRLALKLGAFLWLETAGDDVRTEADGNRYLAKDGQTPVPVVTPSYRVVSGTQTLVGPYLAVEFGP
jgi:hypothetical protein